MIPKGAFSLKLFAAWPDHYCPLVWSMLLCPSRLLEHTFARKKTLRDPVTNNLPAVMIDLKQAFWSILDHKTNLASGRSCLIAIMQRTKLIPVAIGTTKQPPDVFTPIDKKKISLNMWLATGRTHQSLWSRNPLSAGQTTWLINGHWFFSWLGIVGPALNQRKQRTEIGNSIVLVGMCILEGFIQGREIHARRFHWLPMLSRHVEHQSLIQ